MLVEITKEAFKSIQGETLWHKKEISERVTRRLYRTCRLNLIESFYTDTQTTAYYVEGYNDDQDDVEVFYRIIKNRDDQKVFSCECCDADFDECDGWVNDEHIKCGECIGMENNPY